MCSSAREAHLHWPCIFSLKKHKEEELKRCTRFDGSWIYLFSLQVMSMISFSCVSCSFFSRSYSCLSLFLNSTLTLVLFDCILIRSKFLVSGETNDETYPHKNYSSDRASYHISKQFNQISIASQKLLQIFVDVLISLSRSRRFFKHSRRCTRFRDYVSFVGKFPFHFLFVDKKKGKI